MVSTQKPYVPHIASPRLSQGPRSRNENHNSQKCPAAIIGASHMAIMIASTCLQRVVLIRGGIEDGEDKEEDKEEMRRMRMRRGRGEQGGDEEDEDEEGERRTRRR
ncbi:hypothetical protein ACOMHN_059003 [Nucella lapillus]